MLVSRSSLLVTLSVAITFGSGCLLFHGQRYSHFRTSTPVASGETLVLGIMGGRQPWHSQSNGVGRLAARLRAMALPGLRIETLENTKRGLALQLIERAFDRDGNEQLDDGECASVRLVVYGHSFGGAAVIKLARQLQQRRIPILLTVQVDSVGRGDALIPDNVARAANFFQSEGLIISGEPVIRAENPARTEILGNFHYRYEGRKIDLSAVAWYKRLFRSAHTKMEFDDEVWRRVEELIVKATEPRRHEEVSHGGTEARRRTK